MTSPIENPIPSEPEEIKYEKVNEEEFGEFLANFAARITLGERISRYTNHVFASLITVLMLVVAVQVGVAPVFPILTIALSVVFPSFILYVFDQTGDAVNNWLMKKFALLRLKYDLITQRKKKEDDNSDDSRTDSD